LSRAFELTGHQESVLTRPPAVDLDIESDVDSALDVDADAADR